MQLNKRIIISEINLSLLSTVNILLSLNVHTDTYKNQRKKFIDKQHKHISNRPIIDTVLTFRMVLQKNQTDLSYTLCSLLEKYCI